MLLVIQADMFMTTGDLASVQERLTRQAKEGVVVIPRGFHVAYVYNGAKPLEIMVTPPEDKM